MSQTPATAPTDPMAAALARLWAKFLPEIETRVALLSAAAAALNSGSLSAEQREAAHGAAHKLAGSLGTFGLARGTELARQAEMALAEDAAIPAELPSELTAWVAELRLLVRNRS